MGWGSAIVASVVETAVMTVLMYLGNAMGMPMDMPRMLGLMVFGLDSSFVWLVGLATLVPAMGIMPQLREQGARRVLMVAGFHVAYGLGLGLAFDTFARRAQRW